MGDTWCSKGHMPQKEHSLADHDVAPHLVKAIVPRLYKGSSELVTMSMGDVYTFSATRGDFMAVLHKQWAKSHIYGFIDFSESPHFEKDLVDSLGGKRLASVIPGPLQRSLAVASVEAEDMGPALYVDIDSGSQAYTFMALDWLFGGKLA